MWSEWDDAAAQLAAIIDLIENSELNKVALDDGDGVHVTIRRSPIAGGYSVHAVIVRPRFTYDLTLKRKAR